MGGGGFFGPETFLFGLILEELERLLQAAKTRHRRRRTQLLVLGSIVIPERNVI
jgi:hypothetical protein